MTSISKKQNQFFYIAFLALAVLPGHLRAQAKPEVIVVDATASAKSFPHFWELGFGSGRAILTLRESYRSDLREVKKATGFQYVRFHAIFHDEVGVYEEDEQGTPQYNFSYVDQIYDGLLANGVRPFVEISFMPRKLAARQDIHPFWYKQNVSPPKDYAKWDDLIRNFARHLVERYGVAEVSQWYFEVWNEPNIDFWTGDPKQQTYFELYDHTARDLKSVSPQLRVGGPSTAAADWVDAFLKHIGENNVPIDFISSHGYADDTVENLFHTQEEIPMDHRVCRAIRKVHEQITSSSRPSLPLMWTEWNVPSFGALQARDSVYVGAALADDILQCDGLVDMMLFWTFDDVFEEDGPVKEPFYGGFGLIAAGGIKKPSYNAYALLHQLGPRRIPNEASNVLVTRNADGSLVVAVWNLVDPGKSGEPRSIRLKVSGLKSGAHASITVLDALHGNSQAAYARMGKPRYPTREQIKQLNTAGELAAHSVAMDRGEVKFQLLTNGLAIVRIR